MATRGERPPVVLIADDDRHVRGSLRSFLEDADFDTLEAKDGAEALRVFEREVVDLVLADLRMPGMGGLELLTRVKERSPGTPIIVVSGTGAIGDVVEALRRGAWDYLLKPVEDLGVLGHAVESALERARLIRENRDYQEHLESLVARRTEELERTTEELLQAQKMESIGRLAGGVAHDLNNLLSPIVAYAELLSLDLSPDDPRQADLDDVKQAAGRATDLTRQLLAVSRKQVLAIETVDLCQVVAGFENILRRTVREDIALEVDVPGEACFVRADIAQLEQILMNLAVNAQDAMPEGGRMTVEVKRESAAALYFGDTGVGMDAPTRGRIFEPFFTTKGVGEGTGLGLATVYGIVSQHGGQIEVSSEVGRGSRFRLAFPLVAAPAGRGSEREIKERGGLATGDETVLVVEDDPAVRKLVRNVLTRHGYRVLDCGSAEECLERFESCDERIDLLLTDVILPGLNGRELHAALARVVPDLEVLYMSGYTDDVIVRQGVLEPGVDLLQKPIDVEDLTAKVREILDRAGKRERRRDG